jgi:putative membrane protein
MSQDRGEDEAFTVTDLAEDRTILASERTFAGWCRTSLAAIASGIGFQRLFATLTPAWLPEVIATGFLLLAIAIIVLAERRAIAVMRRMSPHVVRRAAPMNLRLLSAAITVGALALIAAMWLID